MKVNYGVYNESSGELFKIGTCSANVISRQADDFIGYGVIELPERNYDYYVDVTLPLATVKVKESLPYSINKTTMEADGVDLIAISGLPNPTTVTWPDGEVTIETDGTVSFTIDLAGEYTVKLQAVPFLEEVINVTATD